MIQRALEIDPQFARAYNARGYIHLRQANLRQAVADFTEAIRLNPTYANAYHNRSVARRMLGDPAGAAEDARSAAKYAEQLSAHR